MIRSPESTFTGRLLGWTAILTTVMVMPLAAYDPINVPKLMVISVGGFMAIGILLANGPYLFKRQHLLVLVFATAFIIDLTIVLFVSGTNFYQEFFGTFGRATGYITYLVLTFLLLAAAIAASDSVLRSFSWYLLCAGLLSVIYGFIQAFNLDPINWVNQYSPVIGFLGNPNFQSSFVGFSCVMAFALIMSPFTSTAWRGGYVVYIALSGYVINETASQQGFFVLAGGIAIVAFVWIIHSRYKFLTVPTLILGLMGFVLVVLGSLNKGPIASILYKDSVSYRGDYWRAGWKMTLENPLFGVGLDSYGDWYRRARNLEATVRRGPDVISNAAHNVLIDFSSNGGIPLMIIYLFMIALVFTASIKVFRRNLEFDPVFSGLFAVWVAYQAQSIISLNQLGLAVWGWIISGLIIGYAGNTREMNTPNKKVRIMKKNKKIKPQSIRSNSVLGIFLGFIFGILIALPPLLQTNSYKSGLESRDLKIIEALSLNNVMPCQNRVQLASLLLQNGLEENAASVAKDGHLQNRDCFDLWRITSQISDVDTKEYKEALAQMKRLDPLNPTLK